MITRLGEPAAHREEWRNSLAQVTFVVPAMHCGGCVTGLRLTLGRRPGIQKLEGDAKTTTLTLQYDESMTTVSEISSALAELGFPVRH